ncbi:hypothetical protein Cfla_2550 [Cellulomonas flavigena DSM 20109]|uniref:DUF3592 domain-containing protein n=1 Tax=Cellulomonas flavigena (strain ATCC 482 / DSM 20109 / BCRC 11376 / JCM 18109 / NBRC 3775 / NCIMB 8073 / NRS 134) TaxID=446466 RepID=D5UI93_CELFN|nr:DUF3592 domain-containing protein [Cellulomonas flavigena]ADG75438.1 hypothetical protein Cfla_2550 [Cellulomonas flavigena DSM 20109]
MTPSLVVPLVFAAFVLLVAVGLLVGGVQLLRRAARTPRTRVPVEAVVVHRTSHRRPASVTFDHAVPGGWMRTTRVEGLPVTVPGGRVAQPGDHITVWAHPQNPADVRLGAGSTPAGPFGVMLVLMGVGATGLALWFVTMTVMMLR